MTVIKDIIERQGQTAEILSKENIGVKDPTYRYERKFFVENSKSQTVEGVVRLHPATFYGIYKPRFINNIYLDTPCFLNYRNALDGLAKRFKARIRWYGDLFSRVCSPQLEIKGKEGYISYKSIYPLKEVEFSRKIDATCVANLLDASELPSNVRSYLFYTRPVLVNRYLREYWRSRDERYRLTLDHDIWFSGFTAFENQDLMHYVESTNVILEIKYNLMDDLHFAGIANKLPFRQSRSSKYMAGMDHIYHLGNYLP
jgi:hypothetical protein